MATQAEYLVNQTVNDCNALLAQLQQAKTTAQRVVERMLAIGYVPLIDYPWPDGYTLNDDFVPLYNELAALPGTVVPDETRDAIYKLISTFQ